MRGAPRCWLGRRNASGTATPADNCHSMSGSRADTWRSRRPFWLPRNGPEPGPRDGNSDWTRPSISRWAVNPCLAAAHEPDVNRFDDTQMTNAVFVKITIRTPSAVSRGRGCGAKVLLSDGYVIGRNVRFRSEWAHTLPFIECRRGIWVLFKEPSELLRLLVRSGEVPIT